MLWYRFAYIHEHCTLTHLFANTNLEIENVNKKYYVKGKKSKLFLNPHNGFCCAYMHVFFSNRNVQVVCGDI